MERTGATPPPAPASRGVRSHVIALVALTFGSGATDAVAFLGMGGVFTANQTGNLVLVGLVGREAYGATALRAVVAAAAFALALYAGFRLTRGPRAVGSAPRLLLAALPLHLLVLLGWWVADAEPSSALILGLLAVSAMAMALQTVAARRMTSAFGIATTFVTGTLTAIFQGVVEGRGDGNRVRVAVVVALVLGALSGATLLELVPLAAPAIAPLAVAGAIAVMRAGTD
ncbi:YoaK family protein [Conexibacter woesei]|uniref:YoaK family protein n=1 Tax=Conexibacter woesei TaxID=191495 RepID=UPI00135F1C19|nr:YoaK family protein [Conexibacter woesei]